jgi:hypothetical protein
MMLNGWTAACPVNHRKSPARNLARLVDQSMVELLMLQKY